MKRNIARTVALTLAIAFLLSLVSTTQVKQSQAAAWTARSWTFPVIDNWGKSLAKGEARGYLYNSTLIDAQGKRHYWGNWTLLATGDVWTNASGSYITFNNLPLIWNNTLGGEVTYTLIIKLKISGSETPITIYNRTVFTLNPTVVGGGVNYYTYLMSPVDLGKMLQYGYKFASGNTLLPVLSINADGFTVPLRVWLYYVALKVVDLQGLPLTVTEVKVTYKSRWTPKNVTWIGLQTPITGIVGGTYCSGTTNGTYKAPDNGLVPVQNPWGYVADCRVGWVILRVPKIDPVSGPYVNRSLVNSLNFTFYYHGTLVGNFSATGLTLPGGVLAWNGAGKSGLPGPIPSPPLPPAAYGIDATVDEKGNHLPPLPPPVTLTANVSQYVVVSVNWVDFALYDQNGQPWPTRNAKVTLYDNDIDNQYPWPGVINPDSLLTPPGTAIVRLRYPVVNHTLKVVVSWFDVTVNVTYIRSSSNIVGGVHEHGGFVISTPGPVGLLRYGSPPGIRVDMVAVWIKAYTSTQVPAPLDPNWVDEVKIRIESRTAPQTTYITKLSYWHGYIILPDTPWGWLGGAGFVTPEADIAMGWLPNGTWSTIDFFVKFKGLEVVNTVTGYPTNTTLKLKCPGILWNGTVVPPTMPWLTDYGKTFVLYAGVYDIGFQVLLGTAVNASTPAGEGTPLFITTPDMQRILVTTDGKGSVTLRDVPSGTYKDFVILYKMVPINCSNVKSVLVNLSTKPLIKLVFPAYYLNITVWNFEGTFKLINLDASFYNTIDYSMYGINNDLLRRALDVEYKRKIVLPDDWAVISPVEVVSPDIGDLIDYLGEKPMAYSKITYRTQLWVTGRDQDGNLGVNATVVWPMKLGLMPAANYSCRISVHNGTDGAVQTGFRPADYNATVYWSEDPYPNVGKIEVSARKAVKQMITVNIYTYIYNVPVQTLDASGQPLKLADMSAVILAEPNDLTLGADGSLMTYLAGKNTYGKPWQLWYMQQSTGLTTGNNENATTAPFYNAYMVRFNTSDTNGANVFHSVNATKASPPTDPDLGTNAHTYPNQSRYLIGMSTFSKTKDNYTFNVYYQGVLVFNDSIPLTNPYTIGVPGHPVTGYHKLRTSVYPYVFEATNDPLNGDTFGVANLKAEVYWAGLNTTWWPTVNLTYRTAAVEFAFLNASKLYKCFNMTVVKRMWGNVTGLETKESIMLTAAVPYYSSFVKVVNGTTDSNGEFKCLVPVWNYSVGTFPTFNGSLSSTGYWYGDVGTQSNKNVSASVALNPRLGAGYDFPFKYTTGGPRRPWNQSTGLINMVWRTKSLFGTPVFVNYTTIPGKTNNVPALDDPTLVGVGPGYLPWPNYKSINATGLINPKTVPGDQDEGWTEGVSLTMNVLKGVRASGTGVLVNNNASKIIYGDFQGRSEKDTLLPNLAVIAGKAPYKDDPGVSVAPPKSASDFFAHIASKTLANDLWVWVLDYAGNALAYQRVEVIRANYTLTRDDEEIVIQPEFLTVAYTPTVIDPESHDYGPVKIVSTPTDILWGFHPLIIRTANVTYDAEKGIKSSIDTVGDVRETDPEKRGLELYANQWLYEYLKGGDIDWESKEYTLQWPAKLDVQIKAGDGSTPIEKAWVFLIYGTNWVPEGEVPGHDGFRYVPPTRDSFDDAVYGLPEKTDEYGKTIPWGIWEIGQNVTASLTDAVGFAASLKVVMAQGPLATSSGTALNLGFNVYKDVYTVKVYYKFKGEDKLYGPVEGTVVWDTFTDQPQHRYIYLGVFPPPTATGEDYSEAQHKIYQTRIWNLKVTLVDQSTVTPRPIKGAVISIPGVTDKLPVEKRTTGTDGSCSIPGGIPAGTLDFSATWQNPKYNPEPVEIARSTITLDSSKEPVITASVYDVELQLLTPGGKPISGANMRFDDDLRDLHRDLGITDSNGKLPVTQLAGRYTMDQQNYPITATWLGEILDLTGSELVVTSTKTYPLIAKNVGPLVVQVVGAQGQGLNAAQVDITKEGLTEPVFSGVSNEQGIVSIEVPFATYNINIDYKGFTGSTSATVDSPTGTVQKVATSVFLELFGQAMTFATFVLWIIVIVIVVLVLAIVVHEYHVWRRKRLPQLFGAPRVPGA